MIDFEFINGKVDSARLLDLRLFQLMDTLSSGILFEDPGFDAYVEEIGGPIDALANVLAEPYQNVVNNYPFIGEVFLYIILATVIVELFPIQFFILEFINLGPSQVLLFIADYCLLSAYQRQVVYSILQLSMFSFSSIMTTEFWLSLENQIIWVLKEREAKIAFLKWEDKQWGIEWERLAIEDRYLNPRSIDGVYLNGIPKEELLIETIHTPLSLFLENPDLVERMLFITSLFGA